VPDWLTLVSVFLPTIILWLFLKFYFPNYLSEKAKNLATKEDIGEITQKVEEVKIVYAKQLEQLKSQHQLKLAALDRRLQAHQEAYTLWRRAFMATHNEHCSNETNEAMKWWEENCLYLDAELIDKFLHGMIAISHHREYLKDRNNPELVKQNWNEITGLGNAIRKAVSLPSISSQEEEELKAGYKGGK